MFPIDPNKKQNDDPVASFAPPDYGQPPRRAITPPLAAAPASPIRPRTRPVPAATTPAPAPSQGPVVRPGLLPRAIGAAAHMTNTAVRAGGIGLLTRDPTAYGRAGAALAPPPTVT